jgi:hypothetical protein
MRHFLGRVFVFVLVLNLDGEMAEDAHAAVFTVRRVNVDTLNVVSRRDGDDASSDDDGERRQKTFQIENHFLIYFSSKFP